jgi:hypothetical protein
MARHCSSAVEQGTHKPLVACSNHASATITPLHHRQRALATAQGWLPLIATNKPDQAALNLNAIGTKNAGFISGVGRLKGD